MIDGLNVIKNYEVEALYDVGVRDVNDLEVIVAYDVGGWDVDV